VIVWDLIYTDFLSPIFEFPFMKATTAVQTSRNVETSRNSNGHISVLSEATVTWSGTLFGVALTTDG